MDVFRILTFVIVILYLHNQMWPKKYVIIYGLKGLS